MRYSHRRLHDLAGAVEKLQTFLPSLTNAKNLQKMRVFRRKTKAEGEGFEPSNTFVLPVFKTGAIGRSAIPPGPFLTVFFALPGPFDNPGYAVGYAYAGRLRADRSGSGSRSATSDRRPNSRCVYRSTTWAVARDSWPRSPSVTSARSRFEM